MLRLSLFAGAFALALTARAQTLSFDGFVGQWTGIITQDSGPTTRYFSMEMSVSPVVDSTDLYDISSHVMDDEYHAYMVGTGYRTDGGDLFIAEREIVRSDSIPGMEWCLKRLVLTQSLEDDGLHVRGSWSGDTSFGACEPGSLDLVRELVRP